MPRHSRKQLLRERLEGCTGHPEGCQVGQPGQHHHHLHGQRQVTARPVEHAESRAGFGIQKLRNAALLDGLRKHADIRPGRAGNGTEENQATGFPAIRNCQFTESHHPNGEIHKGKGERFRSELLAGGGPREAGPVHQFHIGAARLQHPVEDVPPRNDRASRTVPQPGDDESQSDSGVTVCCALY